MICYRDRAFCLWSATHQADKRCVNEECPRCITDEDRAGAEQYGMPFSMADFRAHECGYRMEAEK